MQPEKIAVGIIIRATGEVPMDAGVHPELEQHMISHLVEAGHDVRWTPETGYRIDGWQPQTA